MTAAAMFEAIIIGVSVTIISTFFIWVAFQVSGLRTDFLKFSGEMGVSLAELKGDMKVSHYWQESHEEKDIGRHDRLRTDLEEMRDDMVHIDKA